MNAVQKNVMVGRLGGQAFHKTKDANGPQTHETMFNLTHR